MLNSVCVKACELTEKVGAFIQSELHTISSGDIESKGKNDFVSYVDKTAEKLLIGGLEKLLPAAGFIAEENTRSNRGSTYNWVIDPLDGTTNFIHGLPCYSISLGLLEHDIPVMGIVNELNLKECFYAVENSGAFCNKKPIRVSKPTRLSESLIATGFPYTDFDQMDQYMNLFRDLMEKTHGLRRLGSAAVDLAYVACGRFDAFYEYGLKPWDVAGGSFIVQQAGGTISDFKGGENYLFGKELIACTPGIYREFQTIVSNYFLV